jgi:hypothetical protein
MGGAIAAAIDNAIGIIDAKRRWEVLSCRSR